MVRELSLPKQWSGHNGSGYSMESNTLCIAHDFCLDTNLSVDFVLKICDK